MAGFSGLPARTTERMPRLEATMDGIKDENRKGCCSSSAENAEQVRCACFSSFESPRIVARRKRLLAEVPLVDGSCESRPTKVSVFHLP